jgi:NitT/TauT family transport system permease protein
MKTRSLAMSSLSIASPVALLLLWEFVVRIKLLDPLFFPAPSSIVETFYAFAKSGELVSNSWITLQRIVIGLAIGAVPGVALGLVMGANRWAAAVLDPIVALLYPVPKIAILPLVLLIFGVGEQSKHALVAIGVFFIMLINTQSGVRQIDAIYLDVARAFRIRPLSFYLRVMLPGALPNVFTGLKLSVGIAVVLAVAAEFSAAKSGLGYTIWNGWQTLQVEKMYVALVLVSVMGFLLTLAVEYAERLLIPWRRAR